MIYLDNAATTCVLPEVVDYINKYMSQSYGNPSSLHKIGLIAEKAVQNSAGMIAKYLGVKPEQLIFTSSGTESNNTVILNDEYVLSKKKQHFITSTVEHPSVLACFNKLEALGHDVSYIGVNSQGIVDIEAILEAIKPETALISIMMVNNEIGSINPIKTIGERLEQANYKGIFHSDGTQAVGKLKLDLSQLNLDYFTASAHKFHGPKGVGLLYKKMKKPIKPLLVGGAQQNNQRSSTINVAGVVGMAVALRSSMENYAHVIENMIAHKEQLFTFAHSFGQTCKVVSPDGDRGVAHIITLAFKNIKSEVLLHALEAKGIYISSKSACSSNKRIVYSHVLEGIGLEKAFIDGVIRISTSSMTQKEDIQTLIHALNESVPDLQRITGGQ